MNTIDDLRRRYAELVAIDPTREGAIHEIESALGTALPEDLKAISQFFAGDLLGGTGHYRFEVAGPPTSLTEETLRIREAIGLPQHLVVLAEPPESLIVLDCQQGSVIWLGAFDVHNLVTGRPLVGAPTIWDDYARFFEYLLDQEVEERKWLEGVDDAHGE